MVKNKFDKITNADLNVHFKITAIVLLYWIISITLVFLNKKLMNQLNAPFFTTWFQCLLTALILALIRITIDLINIIKNGRKLVRNFVNKDENLEYNIPLWFELSQQQIVIPKLTIKWNIIRRIFPLSIIFVSMVACNNLSLNFVGVAFYFVVRSLTPVFNVIFTYLILRKNTSLPIMFSCLGIIFGFAYGNYQ